MGSVAKIKISGHELKDELAENKLPVTLESGVS
jgi:hypothetical protein